VAAKTLFDYKGIYRREIQPVIGEKDLDEITFLEIQKMVFLKNLVSQIVLDVSQNALPRSQNLWNNGEESNYWSQTPYTTRA
jgi:hypothetical protein